MHWDQGVLGNAAFPVGNRRLLRARAPPIAIHLRFDTERQQQNLGLAQQFQRSAVQGYVLRLVAVVSYTAVGGKQAPQGGCPRSPVQPEDLLGETLLVAPYVEYRESFQLVDDAARRGAEADRRLRRMDRTLPRAPPVYGHFALVRLHILLHTNCDHRLLRAEGQHRGFQLTHQAAVADHQPYELGHALVELEYAGSRLLSAAVAAPTSPPTR